MFMQVENPAAIVVCHHDGETTKAICDHLATDGYEALRAPTAEEALRFCRYNQPEPPTWPSSVRPSLHDGRFCSGAHANGGTDALRFTKSGPPRALFLFSLDPSRGAARKFPKSRSCCRAGARGLSCRRFSGPRLALGLGNARGSDSSRCIWRGLRSTRRHPTLRDSGTWAFRT